MRWPFLLRPDWEIPRSASFVVRLCTAGLRVSTIQKLYRRKEGDGNVPPASPTGRIWHRIACSDAPHRAEDGLYGTNGNGGETTIFSPPQMKSMTLEIIRIYNRCLPWSGCHQYEHPQMLPQVSRKKVLPKNISLLNLKTHLAIS